MDTTGHASQAEVRRPCGLAALSILDSASTNHPHSVVYGYEAWSDEWYDTKFVHLYCRAFMPRLVCVRFNHLRTSVGRFRAALDKYGLSSDEACDYIWCKISNSRPHY